MISWSIPFIPGDALGKKIKKKTKTSQRTQKDILHRVARGAIIAVVCFNDPPPALFDQLLDEILQCRLLGLRAITRVKGEPVTPAFTRIAKEELAYQIFEISTMLLSQPFQLLCLLFDEGIDARDLRLPLFVPDTVRDPVHGVFIFLLLLFFLV